MRRTSVVFVVASICLGALVVPPSAESQTRRAKPRPNAVVTTPPVLRWLPVQSASLYNVQLWRDGRKVLSRWPARARLELRRTWRYKNRWYNLRPAAYRWYVWPWFGSRYGQTRVRSRFIVGRIPSNTVRPAVAGNVREAATLTASTGRWRGTRPLRFAYRWQRCDAAGAGCADIRGATTSSHEVRVQDVDATLRVVVTATNLARSRSAASATTTVVLPARPRNVTRPRLWGALQRGATLTVDTGSWTSSRPLTYSFRWVRCARTGTACSAIPGATGQAYRLSASTVGRRVRALVTAVNAGGSRTAVSTRSAAVGLLVVGTRADEVLGGTVGSDDIRAGRGDDSVRAGRGPDRVHGGGGRDQLFAGSGNDVVLAADGNRDVVDCGSGRDRVVADRRDRVRRCEQVERPRRSG